jgi:hypothetical protein
MICQWFFSGWMARKKLDHFLNNVNNKVRIMLIRMQVVMGK